MGQEMCEVKLGHMDYKRIIFGLSGFWDPGQGDVKWPAKKLEYVKEFVDFKF